MGGGVTQASQWKFGKIKLSILIVNWCVKLAKKKRCQFNTSLFDRMNIMHSKLQKWISGQKLGGIGMQQHILWSVSLDLLQDKTKILFASQRLPRKNNFYNLRYRYMLFGINFTCFWPRKPFLKSKFEYINLIKNWSIWFTPFN